MSINVAYEQNLTVISPCKPHKVQYNHHTRALCIFSSQSSLRCCLPKKYAFNLIVPENKRPKIFILYM